jgi:hypothetical protein
MKKVLLFLFIGFFSFGVMMAQNILLNGDFESWDDDTSPTSWTHVENTTKEATIIHGGTFSAKHVGGTKDLGQTIAVVPNQTYKFTVWYYVVPGDGTDARIWCKYIGDSGTYYNAPDALLGPDGGYLDNGNGNEWLKYEAIITIPDTISSFYYELRTYKNATVYWDDLTVEEYTSTGTIDLTAPNSGSYQNGDVVHITWTSSDVDSVLLYARMEGLAEPFLITEESAILASVSMFDLPIPADAEEGNYKFILKDKDDPSVADSSDNFIFVKDVVFAGLDDEYPFNPENGAADVPTDLFSGRLEINFQENVQTGTGNIVLKKFSDDSVVETFDVTNAAQVMVSTDDPYTVWIYISSNLDPNTQFYVEVDAGAIKDNAGTPNEFAGFTGNATWTFTTGAFDSFTSIYDIQYTTDPSGDSPHAGEVVKTSGIVMHKYYKSGAYKGFYIQEAAGDWSGIYVYDPGNDDVNIGDEVNVGGTVKEYYDYTQIQDVTLKDVISSSNTLYNPVVVTLAQLIEPYESVLVTVESISCSNPDLGYGEWELTDGTDQSRVDDMFYKYTPVQDEQFTSITGIFVYNYSNFKIEPRDASDIVSAPTRISNVDDAGLVVGPNPVSSEIRISANTSIADVQVINLVGEVMDVETFGAAGRVNVATDGLANGLYLVKVTFTDGTVKTKRIIKR